jgi:PH domain
MNNILPESLQKNDPLPISEEPVVIPFPFSDTDNSDPGVESPREDVDMIRSKQELEQEKSILSGFLKKKGEQRRNWKSRYFVLRPTKLCYYKDEREYETLNLIPLSKIHSVSAIELKKRKFVFGIVTRERIFYLGASTQEEMENWIDNIKNYVKKVNPEARLSVGPLPLPEGNAETSRKDSNASTVSAHREIIGIAALGISTTSDTPRALTSGSSGLQPTTSITRQINVPNSLLDPLRSSVNPSPLQQSWSHDRNAEAQISDFSEDEFDQIPQISPAGPGDDIVHLQGFLHKQRTTLGGVKSWKKYWFVVRNRKLITYKDEQVY